MAEITLKTDILAPEYLKTLSFSGQHPSRLITIIPGLIKEIFRIQGPQVYEDQFKWDTSSDPLMFFVAWRGKDKKDAYSTIWVKITVQGRQSMKDRTGSANVWITADISTKVKSTLPGSMSWFFMKFLYAQQRRRYIMEARRRLDMLEAEIRRIFELREKE